MANSYKVLGQSNPNAATAAQLYTVPAATQAVISTLAVANLSAAATTFRVAVRVGGAVLASAQYLAYDSPLPGNDTAFLTPGITLAAGDIVHVYAGSANVAFSLFGAEIT